MMVLVLGAWEALGCQVNIAAFAAVLLLVMLAPAGLLCRVQSSEEVPLVFVTDAVMTSLVPNNILVSLIGLIISGPNNWPEARTEKSKSAPSRKNSANTFSRARTFSRRI